MAAAAFDRAPRQAAEVATARASGTFVRGARRDRRARGEHPAQARAAAPGAGAVHRAAAALHQAPAQRPSGGNVIVQNTETPPI